MSARNLHRIAGALERLQREAAAGNCQIGNCGKPAIGYIQGTAGCPAGVCVQHAEVAPRYGYTVHSADTDTEATPCLDQLTAEQVERLGEKRWSIFWCPACDWRDWTFAFAKAPRHCVDSGAYKPCTGTPVRVEVAALGIAALGGPAQPPQKVDPVQHRGVTDGRPGGRT